MIGHKLLKFFLLCFLFICTTFSTQASVVISGTRVIYPSDQKSISLTLNNRGNLPSLAQAWLSTADQPEDTNAKTPFIITPPVSRIDPNKEQILRIRYTGEPLAKDRETLFYLHVLDIPPKSKQAGQDTQQNFLQLLFRSRLKFFYRPTNLPYPVQDAYTKVQWQADNTNLKIINPTPYFITYSEVAVKQDDVFHQATESAMVAPFSEYTFTLDKPLTKKTSQIHWQIVNDYGGYYSSTTTLP